MEKITIKQWVLLFSHCKKVSDALFILKIFYSVVEWRKSKPTDQEIKCAIATLNAAGGFQIIRKIDSPKDIIY